MRDAKHITAPSGKDRVKIVSRGKPGKCSILRGLKGYKSVINCSADWVKKCR